MDEEDSFWGKFGGSRQGDGQTLHVAALVRNERGRIYRELFGKIRKIGGQIAQRNKRRSSTKKQVGYGLILAGNVQSFYYCSLYFRYMWWPLYTFSWSQNLFRCFSLIWQDNHSLFCMKCLWIWHCQKQLSWSQAFIHSSSTMSYRNLIKLEGSSHLFIFGAVLFFFISLKLHKILAKRSQWVTKTKIITVFIKKIFWTEVTSMTFVLLQIATCTNCKILKTCGSLAFL